jgi:hypothetical protein
MAHTIEHVRGGDRGGGEIERPLVLLGAGAAEGKPQVPDGLVGELSGGVAEHRLVDQVLRLRPLVGEDAPPDLRQRRRATGVGGVVRTTGPDGVLVEL